MGMTYGDVAIHFYRLCTFLFTCVSQISQFPPLATTNNARYHVMNMNMDPNAMSPWFTSQDGAFPPTNAPTHRPHNNTSGAPGFRAAMPGPSGLSGTVGSSSGYYEDGDDENEFADEPPLLEGFWDWLLICVSI